MLLTSMHNIGTVQSYQSVQNLCNDDFDHRGFQLLRSHRFPETRNIGAQHWQDEAKMLPTWSFNAKVVIEIREIDGKGTMECLDLLHNFQFKSMAILTFYGHMDCQDLDSAIG